MDVMPIYIIERKFAETSGKSLTYPCAPYHAVPSVHVCVVCVRAGVRACVCKEGSVHGLIMPAPFGIPEVQQEMGGLTHGGSGVRVCCF